MLIVERALASNSVTDAKIRLRNNQNLRARNAANTADVSLFKLDATDKLFFQLQPKFASVAAEADDLVNLQTLQDYVSGIVNLKDPVRVASPANQALTGTGALTVDGVSLVDGDRIALVSQTDPVENGVYDYDFTAGDFTLTRSADFDDAPGSEVRQGSTFDVLEGTVNGNKRFLLATVDPEVGTDALSFVVAPSGVIVPTELEEIITLDSTDVSNQYVDLLNEVLDPSVKLFWSGLLQTKGTDYSLSVSGGVTRVTFLGDLASAGAISLANGDKITVSYERE